jgi:uncharacterized protein
MRSDATILGWSGVGPRRVEAAAVRLGDDGLIANGSSLTAGHVLTYRLETGAAWVTRELDVETRGPDGWRRLALRRAEDGGWSAEWDGAEAAARATSMPELDGALDCDLALCPLTNTMPIRRHDLVGAAHRGEPAAHDLVMAWVSVPDLLVHVSSQRYTADAPVEEGGGALVGFESDGFRTTLEVDAHGLVVTYPGLARRLAACPEPLGVQVHGAARPPVLALVAVHEALVDEVAPQRRGVGVHLAEDQVDGGLGVVPARLEPLREPVEHHELLRPGPRDRGQPPVAHERPQHALGIRCGTGVHHAASLAARGRSRTGSLAAWSGSWSRCWWCPSRSWPS